MTDMTESNSPRNESPAVVDGRQWHAGGLANVAAYYRTDPAHGLTRAEAAHRIVLEGHNELLGDPPEAWWKELLEPFTEPMVLLLLVVGVLYAVFGKLEDAVTIFVVIVAVAAIEMFNEAKAKRAVAALGRLVTAEATVIRDGQILTVPSSTLVPGDLVLLDAGARVPADLRLAESHGLRIDESPLTGESSPTEKHADAVLVPDTGLADRTNLAYSGTLVTGGQGRGVVIATGMATEVGRIAGLTRGTKSPRTPLQRQLRRLAGSLVWLAAAFSVLIPVLDVVIAGRPWRDALLEGLTLAFATIPEELPILITVVLGIGAYRLAKQKAIVKHLQAAETLGGVSIIGADKTGTLTENRMRVAEVAVDGHQRPFVGSHAAPSAVPLPFRAKGTEGSSTLDRLLTVGALATGAVFRHDQNAPDAFVGDPTDVALLEAARDAGVLTTIQEVSVVGRLPFDDRRRISATYELPNDRAGANGETGTHRLAVKGTVEDVLERSNSLRIGREVIPLDAERRDTIVQSSEAMAARGLRVIAFAERALAHDGAATIDDENDLTLLGLVGLEDPPRVGVAEAITTLREAGVRVVMITGDHPGTARAIASRVGIDAALVVTGNELERADAMTLSHYARDASVFARVSPEQKLRLVDAMELAGHVVAVMGDGVNDAPALRRATIGVAMGHRGTDAAREAADVVLSDDNFPTVTTAVRAGRVLYENLRKAVRYYLAAKVGLVAASLGAVLVGLPLPFAPVQIIVLELFMDVGASTTFVSEPAEADVMRRPPRDPQVAFLDRSLVAGIIAGGLSLAAAVLVAYLVAPQPSVLGVSALTGQDVEPATVARTAAFATWLLGHIVLAAHMRAEREPLLRRGLRMTWPFAAWAVSAIALAALGPSVPFLARRLALAPLDARSWLVVVGAALILPSWWEVWKWMRWRPRETYANGVGEVRARLLPPSP